MESRPTKVVRANPQIIIELNEQELILLETYSNDSIFKEFGIALLSLFVSGFIAWLSIDDPTTIASHYYSLICSITFCCFIGGLLCCALFFQKRNQKQDVIKRIRARFEAEQNTE